MATIFPTRERRHEAAGVVGASAIVVVAQIAVDMPDGYFGPQDRITVFGAGYSALLLALVLLLLASLRRDLAVSGWLVPLILSANVGTFLPAVVADPLVAGLVVLWNLVLLTQHFVPPPSPWRLRGRLPLSEHDQWLRRNGPALRHLTLVSLALSVAVVGYRLSDHLLASVVSLALGYGNIVVAWPFLRSLWAERRRTLLFVVVPVAGSALAMAFAPAMLALLALAQAGLFVLLLAQHQSTVELLGSFYEHPSRLLVLSFAAVILVGTLLLTFPAAAPGGEPVGALDALFTATSATCVTGLIVLDTPRDLSTFGQLVVLGLIQVGGLGIMTVSTFAALLLGGSLGLRGERALSEMMDVQAAPSALRLTRFIVLATLATEAVGAVALYFCFATPDLDRWQTLWRAVFHAVSAFCNAGFALQSDSIVMFQSRPAALLVFAALITVGGLGFIVLAALASSLQRREPRPVNVQVRLVLVASSVLLLAGTLLFAVTEWNRALAELAPAHKLANALFQSVTPRTAGFSSVEMTALAPATLVLLMLLMFVGASPGSTGGGIKTTTAVVLLAAIRSMRGGREPVRLWRREVPHEIVMRSLAILVISLAIVFTGLFLLVLAESQPFLDLLFEAVSAFGTVGLSLGATAKLGALGKLIVIVVMFVGRTGPLTMALILGTGRARSPKYRYPETRLMVG